MIKSVDTPPDPPDPPPTAASSGGRLIRPFLTGGQRSAGADQAVGSPSVGQTSVRPFLVTSGRTEASGSIGVETQVLSTVRGETVVETLTFEYRDIVALCAEPLAVAEIAAQLSLHLGVTRVLVTDLQQQGLVTTHAPQVDPTDDVDLIMRVINALRQRT
jgi:hypothetical protein